MRQAADMAARDAKHASVQQDAASLYQECATHFRANDNPDVACDMLIQAARCLLDIHRNSDRAMAACDETLQIVEAQGRVVTCDDKIGQCVALALQADRPSMALAFMRSSS